MNDTTKNIKQKQLEIILSKTNEDRFEMGISMMQVGYDLIKERLEMMYPNASKKEMSFLIFESLYKKDFSEKEILEIKETFN